MSNHWTEDDYFRADAAAHFKALYGDDYDVKVPALLLGIKIHEADAELGNRILRALIKSDHLALTGEADQMVASMQTLGKRPRKGDE